MKNKILIGIICLLMVTTAYGLTWDHNKYMRNLSWVGSGSTTYDPLYRFMQETGNIINGDLGTGKVWYVDRSATGNRSGESWTDACLTIKAANDKSYVDGGADRGDRINVAQGHYEDGVVGTAIMWQASVSGITVHGIGEGSLMPRMDFNFTSNTCQITADNVTIEGIRFRPSLDAIAIGLEVTSGSDYARILGNEFGYAETATDEFAIAVNVGTSTGAVVAGNLLDAGTAQAVTGVTFEAATGLTLEGNTIRGDYSTANINNAITLCGNVKFGKNLLWNGVIGGLNTEPVWEVLAGTIGTTNDNDAYANLADVPAAFLGAGLFNTRNTYNETPSGTYASFDISFSAATTTTSVLPGHGE